MRRELPACLEVPEAFSNFQLDVELVRAQANGEVGEMPTEEQPIVAAAGVENDNAAAVDEAMAASQTTTNNPDEEDASME